MYGLIDLSALRNCLVAKKLTDFYHIPQIIFSFQYHFEQENIQII